MKYAVAELFNIYFLCRGEFVFDEIYIPKNKIWKEENLVGIYDGDIEVVLISEDEAEKIMVGSLSASELFFKYI